METDKDISRCGGQHIATEMGSCITGTLEKETKPHIMNKTGKVVVASCSASQFVVMATS